MTRSIQGATRLLFLALPLLSAACGGGGDPLSPPTTGGVAVTVTGLPASVAASITLTGPGGFSRVLTASGNVDGLAPGTYTLAAANVAGQGSTYAPATASQAVVVPASTSRVQASVTYAPLNSQIVLTLSGLPVGAGGNVLVTNASGFSRTVTATTTLAGLAPGIYTIAASTVTSGSDTYAPNPASQQVQVTIGQSTSAAVSYAVSVPGTVNLLIDGLTITQSVQSYDDTVPLIANRDAYVRVFVRADQVNTVAPAVRVRLYQGANPTPVVTYTLSAPVAAVPMTVDQGTLTSSWNQLIPANLMTTGLRITADVDPGNAVPESNEGDNSYPLSGLQKQLDVRAVAPIEIHFVPVIVKGDTGNVTSANMNQFVATLKKVMPLQPASVTVSLRPVPYASAADTMTSANTGSWSTVLSEIYTLQAAEGTGKYFYGVVKTKYGSGIAGIGYVGQRGAVGWDRLPSGDGVLAHEVGHNFSLNHAPGCNAGGPDMSFPFPDGTIGNWGLDVGSLALKAPSTLDLMGYCGGGKWIGAYHYQKALNYRQSLGAVRAGSQPGLLVWGRITNGVVTLEPAFEIMAPMSVPERRGAYQLEGLDDRGTILFSYNFAGELVADQDGEQRQFAFVIPLNAARSDRLARLRVRGGLRTAEWASAAALRAQGKGQAAMLQQQPASGGVASLVASGSVRLRWNASAYPMALVRDAATGDILSFARNGEATVGVAGRDLDVTFSDGVRSRRERVTPQ